jgi:hypothetical protein
MSKDLGSYVDVDQDRQIVVPSYERSGLDGTIRTRNSSSCYQFSMRNSYNLQEYGCCCLLTKRFGVSRLPADRYSGFDSCYSL